MDMLRERKETTLRNFENCATACDIGAIVKVLSAHAGDIQAAAKTLVADYFVVSPERAEKAFMPALEAYEHEAREKARDIAEMGKRINDKNFAIDTIISNFASMGSVDIIAALESARKI